jgi:hypothetical protein
MDRPKVSNSALLGENASTSPKMAEKTTHYCSGYGGSTGRVVYADFYIHNRIYSGENH